MLRRRSPAGFPWPRRRPFVYTPARSLSVCFFGTDEVSVFVLEALVESLRGRGLHAGLVTKLGVVTLGDRPVGRNKKGSLPAAEVAAREGLKTWLVPHGLRTLKDWTPPHALEQWEVGVVASFGFKLPAHILGTLDGGAINVHPSLLPRYRGAAPVPHALLNGDATTGVTIMRIHPDVIDAGEILKQIEVPIKEHDTSARQVILLRSPSMGDHAAW